MADLPPPAYDDNEPPPAYHQVMVSGEGPNPASSPQLFAPPPLERVPSYDEAVANSRRAQDSPRSSSGSQAPIPKPTSPLSESSRLKAINFLESEIQRTKARGRELMQAGNRDEAKELIGKMKDLSARLTALKAQGPATAPSPDRAPSIAVGSARSVNSGSVTSAGPATPPTRANTTAPPSSVVSGGSPTLAPVRPAPISLSSNLDIERHSDSSPSEAERSVQDVERDIAAAKAQGRQLMASGRKDEAKQLIAQMKQLNAELARAKAKESAEEAARLEKEKVRVACMRYKEGPRTAT